MLSVKKTLSSTLVAALAASLLVGCGEDKDKRAFTFVPNMHDQESVRAQETEPSAYEGDDRLLRSMRQPIDGTVPTHFNAFQMAEAGDQQNPLPRTMDVLQAGRRAYNIYCIVCHGPNGDGDGNVIPNMSKEGGQYLYSGLKRNHSDWILPPTPVNGENVQAKTDSALFLQLTKGGAIMPSYKRLSEEMRWSIVHYLRVLYKAKHATKKEHEDYIANKSDYSDPEPTDIVNQWREVKN